VCRHFSFSVLLVAVAMLATTAAAEDPTWKAGVAKAKITPREPRWMSGYGHRLARSDHKGTGPFFGPKRAEKLCR